MCDKSAGGGHSAKWMVLLDAGVVEEGMDCLDGCDDTLASQRASQHAFSVSSFTVEAGVIMNLFSWR